MTRLSLIIIALTFWFTWRLYPQLPPIMVTHWGISGAANGWMSRSSGAWFVPILMILIWLVFEIAPHTHTVDYNKETFRGSYQVVGVYSLLFLGLLHALVLGVNLSAQIDMLWAVSWMLVVFMALLGQLLPQLTRNPIMGIRTPWTMRSDRVWRRTHLATGRVLRGLSLLCIIFLLVFTRQYGFSAVLICFLGGLLWGVLYSYLHR